MSKGKKITTLTPLQQKNLDKQPDIFKFTSPTAKTKRQLKRVSLMTFITVSAAGWVYLNTPLSELNLIRFNGLSYLSKADIIRLANVSHTQKMYEIRSSVVASRLETHPLVASAQVKKSGLNELAVEIVEKEILGCVPLYDKNYLLTTAGEWIDQDSVRSQTCQGLLFYEMEQIDKETNLPLLTQGLMTLGSDFLALLEEVCYEPEYGDVNRFSLRLKDGNLIKINAYTFTEKLQHYPTLLARVHQTYGEVTGIFHLDVGDRFVVNEEYMNLLYPEDSEDSISTDSQWDESTSVENSED